MTQNNNQIKPDSQSLQMAVSGSVTRLLQTRLKTESQRGNCFPTAIGCLLGMNNPEDVVQVQEYYDRDDVLWIEVLDDWLAKRGLEHEYISGHLFNDEFYLVSGNTVRNIMHVCVYQNGKLWHDPHPAQTGLVSETSFATIRPLTDR